MPKDLTLVARAILGTLMPHVAGVVCSLFRRFGKHPLLGHWYEYHTSFKNSRPDVLKTYWEIKLGYSTMFSVVCRQTDLKVLYKGKITSLDGQLEAILVSSHRNARVTFRYENPASWNAEPIAGIWLSIDVDGNIASGGTLLSKNRLSDDEALRAIKLRIQSDRTMPLLRKRPGVRP